MAAFLIGHIKVRDDELWQQYVSGVRESLTAYAARIIFRGQLAADLAGHCAHDLAVVIEFPDLDELNAWYHSAKYQSLIPIRDRAADVIITSFQQT